MAKKKQKIIQLEILTAEPNFWQDQEKAKNISQELSDLKEEISLWDMIEQEMKDLLEMMKLIEEKKDEDLEREIAEKYKQLERKFRQEEIKVFLGGQYDRHNAYLSIYAGAGGTEAQDWAEMLSRMYSRYAEKKGWKAQIVEISYGQEAGIKSAVIEIKGKFAYGYLKKEAGVHRLVRLSPFNANNLRHTSFALVEILPEVVEAAEVEINPIDLRVDTYRSSGPGGQNVNKVESAVRITHLPTNIVVSCQIERSQAKNKERAMKMLKNKLHQYQQAKNEEEKAKLKGERPQAAWGNQIRSYVLHPYKMVKDLRTNIESKQPEEILDGDLDEFIEAEIRIE
ncbi:MAG: Peptide chain release factor 2 [Parcubacteria group bacterium GW2011_GWF2_39_13b]|nr:MAG: Peptide chain release factor 2 [Parcubacteria group bacterium GW2011_GWF2_39_13b]